jgi:hypothetical protein
MRGVLVLTITIFFLFGCTTIPPRPNPNVVEREIVENILGELCRAVISIRGLAAQHDQAAVGEHFAANDGWLVLVESSLKTDLEGSVSPSVTWVGPIIPGLLIPKGGTAGTYNLGIGGTIDQTSTTLRDDKRYVVLDTLMKDTHLCPQPGTDEYLAYFSGAAEYQGIGKYLSGSLGIRDWLATGVAAQNFGPVVGPTTILAEGPQQSDDITGLRLAIQRLESTQRPLQTESTCNDKNITIVDKNKNISDWYLAQGQQVIDRQVPLPFKSCFNMSYKLTAAPSASWLSDPTDDGTYLIFNSNTTIPNSASSFKATVEANNGYTKKLVSFNVYIYAAPKATSFGPTYSGQFTFVIKGTGQIDPSFTLDRIKGGSTALFSMIPRKQITSTSHLQPLGFQ